MICIAADTTVRAAVGNIKQHLLTNENREIRNAVALPINHANARRKAICCCIRSSPSGYAHYDLVLQCSTSCGLGAIWRSVHCSTGNDPDCDVAKRPLPARRCHLRPCAIWKAGRWSKVRLLECSGFLIHSSV